MFEEAPVADICSLVSRGVTPAYDESGILVINQKCVRDNRVTFELARITNPERKKVPLQKKLQLYDVLVNSTGVGTLGRVAQVKQLSSEATADSHVSIVRPDSSKIDPRFFGYAMVYNQPKIEAMGEGATGQTELSRIRLGQEIFVPLPPPLVQRRIAGILSAHDELIENCQLRIKILESIARALYREWFVHLRVPGFEHHPRVASPLGEIPNGWEVKPLGDVATITMGLSPKGDTYNANGQGTPLVNGPVEFGERFTKEVKWTTAPSKLCKDGDLIVCVRGSTTGKYVKSKGVYCLGRGVCSMSSKYQNFIDQLFEYELPALLGQTSGSTFPSWTGPQLKGYPVLCPPNDVLSRFDALIKPMTAAVLAYSRKIENLRRTRDLLLPRLLSGQIEVEAA